jgi:hypothetical protein
MSSIGGPPKKGGETPGLGKLLPFRTPGLDGSKADGSKADGSKADGSKADGSKTHDPAHVETQQPSPAAPSPSTTIVGATTVGAITDPHNMLDAGGFVGVTRAELDLPAAPVDGAGKSQLEARLAALGLDPVRFEKPDLKLKALGPTVLQTAEGKVMSGSLTIETREQLKQLSGIVRVGGDLTLQEGTFRNTDLLALSDLVTIEGRLTVTFEGNGA